ncbi:MAG TPA: mechanosensitive ion channel domain-containing protein [Geobacterales bacterium]|nr:mechanosensitive ion channel domain-containing protein [Geobacterales bacterium]
MSKSSKGLSNAIIVLVIYIIAFVIVSAILQYLIVQFLPTYKIDLSMYSSYIFILLSLAFGILIGFAFANVIYESLKQRQPESTALAVRNVIRIVAIGAVLASIAGGVAGGAAGVALGGFLALVIGFASQQVLGQVIAGLFILIARPFKIGERVVLLGDEGEVLDVGSLFVKIKKDDETIVLIPNSSIISQKIYLKRSNQTNKNL